MLSKLPAKKYLLFFLAKSEGAKLFTHPPFTDHLARCIGCPLNIVTSSAGHLLQHQFFGCTPSHKNCKTFHKIFFRIGVLFIHGKLLSQSHSTPTRYNSDFVNRVSSRYHLRNQGVACLMICGASPLFITYNHALASRPHKDFVFRLLKISHLYKLLVTPGSQKRRFIDHIFKVRSGEPGSTPRKDGQINIVGHRSVTGVHLKDFLPTP